VVGIANDNVVEDFDFEKLTSPDEVTGDFDVGFGWCRLTARMIVLCEASVYVELKTKTSRTGRFDLCDRAGFFT